MLKFLNNLTTDMKAIIATIGVFIVGYFVTLAPVWVAASLFGVAAVSAIYVMFKAIFTLQSWDKEDKE